MLIISGNFIEIQEDYFEKFKIQIKSYESSLGKEESVSEKQQIEKLWDSGNAPWKLWD